MNEKNVKWICLEEVSSTNDYAKGLLAKKEDTIIRAKRQSGGRGTKGRSFSSNEGGAYLSALRFYQDFPAKAAFQIMAGAAVAVCETLRHYGLSPKIKWANDVFVGGKKICGILIENTFSGGNISSSIVGIGLNVNNLLEKELSGIATTMEIEGGKRYCVEEVIERLVDNLYKAWTMDDYRAYLGYMGERATLLIGDERIPATLLSVTDEGNLAVEIEGNRREISAGEVSLRL